MPYTINCFACTSAGHLALEDVGKSLDMGLNADDIGALQCIADYAEATHQIRQSEITEQFNRIYDRVNLTRLVTLKLLTFKDPNNKIQHLSHPLLDEWQQWQVTQTISNDSPLSEPTEQTHPTDDINSDFSQSNLEKVTLDKTTLDSDNDLSDDGIEPALRLLANRDF